jgi:hypothetical protein
MLRSFIRYSSVEDIYNTLLNPSCLLCKHFIEEKNIGNKNIIIHSKCKLFYDKRVKNVINYTDHKPMTSSTYMYAMLARCDNNYCGLDGKHFIPKNKHSKY